MPLRLHPYASAQIRTCRFWVQTSTKPLQQLRLQSFQTIYLLAKGHSKREVAEITSFGLRWVEQLLERYNAFGPVAPGDLRRDNCNVVVLKQPHTGGIALKVLAKDPCVFGVRITTILVDQI